MKKLFLAIAVTLAFLAGYSGGESKAYPAGGVWGRGEYNGYFTNENDTYGAEVLRPVYDNEAFPSNINSATEFINFIKYTKLDIDGNNSGTLRDRTGAAFIIHTMIGSSLARRWYAPSAAQISEWEARVRFAEANGRISWRSNYSFRLNSFWQGGVTGTSPRDDAFYDDSGTLPAMLFRNAAGTVVYALKWDCGNPVGTTALGPLPDDTAPFNMDGFTTVNDTTPIPGQAITFTHHIENIGTGTSPTITRWHINNLTGAITQGPFNSGTFTAGQEKSFNEAYTVPLSAVPGSQICRNVRYSPNTSAGGTENGDRACATVQYSFTLRPTITTLVNGAPLPASSVAEPGDTVQFQYAVVNSGVTISTSAACTLYRNAFTGYHPAPTPAESTAGWAATAITPPCPFVFPPGNTPLTTANETIVLGGADINRSLCRILELNPETFGGGPVRAEACVQVGAKPYLRVFEGDVSVGNGQSPTCTNSNSGIATWNKESPTFGGAGATYAAYAIGQINDFATAYGNAAGAAPGRGLAFANTTASGTSIFGGSFGSLPCIPDYYARRLLMPTTPLPSSTLSTLNGLRAYTTAGPIALRGNINPGQQSTIYVDGDVLIEDDITYSGSGWSTENMPLLQLVVRGNIYIAEDVTQMDGVYIAQPSNATNGVIYTCANPGLPGMAVSTNDTSVLSRCDTQLTVNGAFIAREVQFLRTRGTLSQSTPAETSTSANIAEVFNFTPAVWIQQPVVPSDMQQGYDAITSLPPVL